VTDAALAAWLQRLEGRSPEARVELGLERVVEVLHRLGSDFSGTAVVTVAGTNGKGSTVAFLEAIYAAAGYSTFAYTSPHVYDFRERMRVDGQLAPVEDVVAGLERVEACRQATRLTYFEHVTLSALCLAAESRADVLLLEVGLGGRLDAVNAIDPDIAVLTSIGLDHTEWLGTTRLAIGREKAGVARAGRPFVVGEKRLPRGLLPFIEDTGARLLLAGRDFDWWRRAGGLSLITSTRKRRWSVAPPGGRWQSANAACAVVVSDQLANRLPVTDDDIARALQSARLPARCQRVATKPDVFLDVAHNPAAARALAAALPLIEGRTRAVFSAMFDKDIDGIVRPMAGLIDEWFVAAIDSARACPVDRLVASVERLAVRGRVEAVESVPEARRRAIERSTSEDRVVVFGSFRTVAEAWPNDKTPI
jgi:dihydrofolate synthase/folylpolyglutamate synthase